jgi:anthranilate phosphoribosyltransferase
MLTPYIKKLINHENLSSDESIAALQIILTAKNHEQIAAFLVLMRAKGETLEEMSAFVHVMQQHQINIDPGMPVLDIVGTGGDGANTANISTGASILAASCGVPVLKHGNRAASSQAGAGDVLQALGLNLQQSVPQIVESVKKNNIGFCFAPNFHPQLLGLKPIRQQLKVPTLFNLLGPLLNPGHAPYMVLGVFDPTLMPLMANILIKLNMKRAMVVHGNGLDELNCLGTCEVIEINGENQKRYQINPNELGLPICQLNDLKGGNAQDNAHALKEVLQNKQNSLSDTIVLNAAAAVYIYGKADSIKAAIPMVRAKIESGHAMRVLEDFIHA